VDPALQAKPVMVVNADAVPPDRLLQALADLYGLRVRTEPDGSLRLTRRAFRPAAQLTDLPESIRRVFPEPFRRGLLHQRAGSAPDAIRPPDSPDPALWKEFFAKQEARRQLPSLTRIEAVRRLRSTLEPKVKAAPDNRVPVSALDELERQALATIVMANCVLAVRNLLVPTPEHIAHFDRSFIVGGVGTRPDGKAYFSLAHAVLNPDGKTVRVAGGFGGAEYTR